VSTCWNTNDPPKDGTAIIVVGRVIFGDELSTVVDSFVAAVRWTKEGSGFEGWHFDRDGMSVARTLEDEVKVDWWAAYPKEDAAPAVEDTANELKLAKAAIAHVLNAIADDPRKYWLMGNGTESYAKLTEAAAAIWKLPVEKVCADFQPKEKAYKLYCAEREENERLLRHCQENKIMALGGPVSEERESA
jgi:hypothetical protein